MKLTVALILLPCLAIAGEVTSREEVILKDRLIYATPEQKAEYALQCRMQAARQALQRYGIVIDSVTKERVQETNSGVQRYSEKETSARVINAVRAEYDYSATMIEKTSPTTLNLKCFVNVSFDPANAIALTNAVPEPKPEPQYTSTLAYGEAKKIDSLERKISLIKPGMTAEAVRAELGPPQSIRQWDPRTLAYWWYGSHQIAFSAEGFVISVY